MAKIKPEVKTNEDVREIKITEPIEDDSETVTPPLSPEAEAELKEKATPAGSSAANKPAEAVASEVPTQPEEKLELKDVPGELPEVKAMRKEITRLKMELRETHLREHIGQRPDVAKEQSAAIEQELAKLTEQYGDLKPYQEIFKTLVKAEGIVTKTESYQDQVNNTLNEWLETHSEYLPESSSGDDRWNAFEQALQMYKQPAIPRDFKRIFDKIDKDVREQFGEPADEPARQQAQTQKLKSISHSGGTKSEPAPKRGSQLSPEVRAFFKGFSDEDFEPEE